MQIPIAVAENNVGNRSAFDRNTRLNELDAPILLKSINKGIQFTKETKKIIVAPPTKVNPRQIMKANRIPNF